MAKHESAGMSDEWYTPKYIFDALGCKFNMDVSAPVDRTHCHVPANIFITKNADGSQITDTVNLFGRVVPSPPTDKQS